jgi:hypothetical protein
MVAVEMVEPKWESTGHMVAEPGTHAGLIHCRRYSDGSLALGMKYLNPESDVIELTCPAGKESLPFGFVWLEDSVHMSPSSLVAAGLLVLTNGARLHRGSMLIQARLRTKFLREVLDELGSDAVVEGKSEEPIYWAQSGHFLKAPWMGRQVMYRHYPDGALALGLQEHGPASEVREVTAMVKTRPGCPTAWGYVWLRPSVFDPGVFQESGMVELTGAVKGSGAIEMVHARVKPILLGAIREDYLKAWKS